MPIPLPVPNTSALESPVYFPWGEFYVTPGSNNSIDEPSRVISWFLCARVKGSHTQSTAIVITQILDPHLISQPVYKNIEHIHKWQFYSADLFGFIWKAMFRPTVGPLDQFSLFCYFFFFFFIILKYPYNALTPERWGNYSASVFFKLISWIDILSTSCEIGLGRVPQNLIDDKPTLFNSLGPSDAIWWQKTGSTLAQVMACCLTAPSHYLNQCWLIISEVQCHSY